MGQEIRQATGMQRLTKSVLCLAIGIISTTLSGCGGGGTPVIPKAPYRHGVAFGGWFVMETHWMYDQFSAPSENDWVGYLRANPPSGFMGGDTFAGDYYAIQTMKNHWGGYYTPEMLQKLAENGINSARIAVGYWMFDIPVAHAPGKKGMTTIKNEALILNLEGCQCVRKDSALGSECSWAPYGDTKSCKDTPRPPSMYDFGFNAEGFATGGLNYLEKLIPTFKQYSIELLIDLHAAPSGTTHLNSYPGVWVNNISNFWNAEDAHFGGTAYPAQYEAAPSANCGLQGGEFIDPNTWDGDDGCSLDKTKQKNRTNCSCGPSVRGSGNTIYPGHFEDSGIRYYQSSRTSDQCAVDPATGQKFGAPGTVHKAPWSYNETQLPNGSCKTWMDVGVSTLVTMAQWIVDLQSAQLPGKTQYCNLRECADVVFGLETINEPALGMEGDYLDKVENFEKRVVPTIHQIFAESPDVMLKLETTLQFTGDATAFTNFISSQKTPSSWLPFVSLDFHKYYTWNNEVDFCTSAPDYNTTIGSDVHSKSECTGTPFKNITADVFKNQDSGPWQTYIQGGIKTYIGEWALATNGDNVNLADPSMNNRFSSHDHDNRQDLSKWFCQQKKNWKLSGASGDFYWTARMGSGWEPRPDKCAAAPCQVNEGSVQSAFDVSLDKFRFPTWNYLALLLELPNNGTCVEEKSPVVTSMRIFI